jgi:hypothetical protein
MLKMRIGPWREVGMPRMLSSTWSSARCSFDAIFRMSSGGEGLLDGLYAILGISSGVAMLTDFDSTKGTIYGQFIICSK